jgi:hypothetical protein
VLAGPAAAQTATTTPGIAGGALTTGSSGAVGFEAATTSTLSLVHNDDIKQQPAGVRRVLSLRGGGSQ